MHIYYPVIVYFYFKAEQVMLIYCYAQDSKKKHNLRQFTRRQSWKESVTGHNQVHKGRKWQ